MLNIKKLDQLAKLAVRVGVNVQKNQNLVIRSTIESKKLVSLITKNAYDAGANRVSVIWSDDEISKINFKSQSKETLSEIPEYIASQYKHYVEKDYCFISVSSPNPGYFSDVNSEKLRSFQIASNKMLGFFRSHMMGNKSQWTIVASANENWAKKVFPEKTDKDRLESLWNLIFEVSRIDETKDIVEIWKEHNNKLLERSKWLNGQNFNKLIFKNKLGTDLEVELVKDHIWVGGGETTTKGVYFNPNIPTEENFTMPHKFGVNGMVHSSKPLSYQGKIIKNFWFKFEKGKVIDYDAEEGLDALKNLFSVDEGSSYAGEIALVENSSPVSKTGKTIYSTLFDENASCHMALGKAYPMNIKNGINSNIEDLIKKGYNNSLSHVDFMFGTKDMNISGIKENGEKVDFFIDGEFSI
jgi:aminopeptidase